MISSSGIGLIVFLIILSGAIAFIGNNTGRFFGKHRLSIFNLRPRHTAFLFTVSSGVLIMALTFGALLLFSRDARVALLGMEELKREINETNKKLKESKLELVRQENIISISKRDIDKINKEKDVLEESKKKLDSQINRQKSESIV